MRGLRSTVTQHRKLARATLLRRALPIAVLLSWAIVSPCTTLPPGDPVFQAMKGELDRTMEELRMDDMPKPYFVAYTVQDVTWAVVSASFGGLETSDGYPWSVVKVQVRVGGYDLDNTNFAPSERFWRGYVGIGGASFEGDYDNLRYTLWAETDNAYKNALENLARKKALLEKLQLPEVLPDLSRETPVVSLEKAAPVAFDRGVWEKRIKDLSAVFRSYPDLQSSEATLWFKTVVRRFINSEETVVMDARAMVSIDLSARAQTRDGLPVSDELSLKYPGWEDVPSQETLRGEARNLAQGMVDMVHGSAVESYVGPVLFENQAAADFFNTELVQNLCIPRGILSEDSRRSLEPAAFAGRIGMRVAVPFLSIVDDPLLSRYQGTSLIGSYRFDDEGVPARRLRLVEKGKLLDVYMSRAPIEDRAQSNGHGRAGLYREPVGFIGNLIVTPEKAMPLSNLKKKLRSMCRALDIPYGILVRRMDNLHPVVAYKVYAADGREEPVCGMEFSDAGFRPLRDIVAASREMFVFNYDRREVPASIVCPSILVPGDGGRQVQCQTQARALSRAPVL